MLANKTGAYTLTAEDGSLWQVPDDGRPVGTVYAIDEQGGATPVPVAAGAFERIKEWNQERLLNKSDRLNDKAADGGKIAAFRAQRVDSKIERRDIERPSERTAPTKKTEEEAVSEGSRQGWQENFDRTNPSSSAAEVYTITKLLEVGNFKARLINNGSTSNVKVLKAWSGPRIVKLFGDSGTDVTLFNAANQVNNFSAPMQFAGGLQIKLEVLIPASGTCSLILEGTADNVQAMCG